MTQKIYQVLIAALFLLSAYGWGRLTRRYFDRRIYIFHSLTAIIGLAVLSFIGGLLNLAHLVGTPALLVLTAIGLGASTHYLLRERPWRLRTFPRGSIPLFVASAIAGSVAWLLMPGGVFNVSDDFHTYIARAARMTQTGSLGGNVFDSLGLDSLGSASFFHSFFLSAGRIEMLNGFDPVACFALCLLLIAELSLRWRMPWWLGLCAILGLVWINPQYVNISPLYAGAAGIMGLTLCGILAVRTLVQGRTANLWKLTTPIGLLAAWLVTMKVTLALFASVYLTIFLVLLLIASPNRRAVIKTAFATTLVIVSGILPWALALIPALLRARGAGENFIADAPLAHKYGSLTAREVHFLFDPIALLFGDTPVFYLLVCGVALALSIVGLVHWLRHRSEIRAGGMIGVAAVGIAMFAALFLNSHIFPIAMAIRYSCPAVIGGAFIVALGFVRSRTASLARTRSWVSAALAGTCAVLIVSFNETLLERWDMARGNQTLLAYNVNHSYAEHSREMISASEAGYHLIVQTNIPAKSAALVWTTTPFHFDFSRNPLITLSLPGISSPALQFPAGVESGTFERYLRSNGVHFVILETNGYGVTRAATVARMQKSPLALYRKLGDYAAYLRTTLDEIAARSKVLYSDGRMVVFELGNKAESPARTDSLSKVTSL